MPVCRILIFCRRGCNKAIMLRTKSVDYFFYRIRNDFKFSQLKIYGIHKSLSQTITSFENGPCRYRILYWYLICQISIQRARTNILFKEEGSYFYLFSKYGFSNVEANVLRFQLVSVNSGFIYRHRNKKK